MKQVLLIGMLAFGVMGASGCVITLEDDMQCEYGKLVYDKGDTFPSHDGCNTCKCDADGTVACTLMDCADTCEYNGTTYQIGDTFMDAEDCNECTCTEYGVSCTDQDCDPGCMYYGEFYVTGAQFPSIDSCNTCECYVGGGVACTEIYCPLPAMNFEDELTQIDGCSDIFVAASNSDDTTSLIFKYTGAASKAHSDGTDPSFTFSLPDDEVELFVQIGRNLSINNCNDVDMGTSYIVKNFKPISGTLEVTLTRTGEAQPWDYPTDIDLVLTDVVFQEDGGLYTRAVDSFELNDVAVGWFPG